jgi:glycosyltransferase involved in cell wall biosynthesis
MNYLVATEYFFPDRPGGSGRVAWELAKLMRDRGHRVGFLAAARPGTSSAGVSEHEGVDVVRYLHPQFRSWDPRRLDAHVRAAASGARRLEVPWDVVHSHALAPGLGAFAAHDGARRIATVHSPAVLEQRITWSSAGPAGRLKLLLGEPVLKRAERRLYDQATSLMALSRYTVDETRAIHGQSVAGRMTVIPWWSEPPAATSTDRLAARRELGWDPTTPAFFTLRRLVPRMGLDTLVRAAAALPRERPWSVFVGGDGPERAALEALAGALGVADRVRFLGRMSDGDLDLAYAACDAFVLPTRALECFGIIALEALARGRPVVGARVGAIPEVLDPILPGWLFPPGDAPALAGLLSRVLEGDLAPPAPERLRDHAEERYGRRTIGERWAAWIEGRES